MENPSIPQRQTKIPLGSMGSLVREHWPHGPLSHSFLLIAWYSDVFVMVAVVVSMVISNGERKSNFAKQMCARRVVPFKDQSC
jgi:hypothetical protein